jgi:hypothetical protein
MCLEYWLIHLLTAPPVGFPSTCFSLKSRLSGQPVPSFCSDLRTSPLKLPLLEELSIGADEFIAHADPFAKQHSSIEINGSYLFFLARKITGADKCLEIVRGKVHTIAPAVAGSIFKATPLKFRLAVAD